jgi:hypothetical protein
VRPETKISEIWTLFTVKSSVPRSRQRLVFHGKTLQPHTTLAENSITDASTIHLIVPPAAPKKQKCTFKDCKDAAQRIVGDCGFCRGHFCGKHRLLEDHKCDGLDDVSITFLLDSVWLGLAQLISPRSLQCKKESHDANANKLISERTMAIKGI